MYYRPSAPGPIRPDGQLLASGTIPFSLARRAAGGVAAGVLFELMKRGFALYVSYFPTYTLVYGAFAAVPVFLLWRYLSWLVVIVGATLTALIPSIWNGGGASPVRYPSRMSLPSRQPVARRERLIVALDVPSVAEAKALVERLGDAVRFYKIGLELFTSGSGTAGGYFELLEWLVARDCRIFADLKLYDIPETVRRAVANLRGRGVSFLTVHGHGSVMQAAAREKGEIRILAVTVLTSFDQRDLAEMGSTLEVPQLVMRRAQGAVDAGCDGVIASGLEAGMLKAEFGSRLLVVTPGIRPAENKPADDQKRTVDVAQAFANGADYIVVGRPIRDAADLRAAAEAIQKTIAEVFPD